MGPHHVETAVRKRQSQDVTDLVAGQGVQTGSLREELGYATNDGERSAPITRQPSDHAGHRACNTAATNDVGVLRGSRMPEFCGRGSYH
jgi:hypothetical protein